MATEAPGCGTPVDTADRQASLRAELATMSLKLLKRRAKALGVDDETIEDLDDAVDMAEIMVHPSLSVL